MDNFQSQQGKLIETTQSGTDRVQQSFAQLNTSMRNGSTSKAQHPIRLSIVTQFYPPDYAATGQLLEELASQLVDQGLHIQIFTGQPGYAYQKQTAPTIERLPSFEVQRSRTSNLWPQRIRGKALNGLMFCLRSALHLLKPWNRRDVLLVTTAPPYLPILGYLANVFFGTPYICLLYDLYPDVAVELKVVPPQYWLIRLWNLLNQRIWGRASAIIVLSSTMKDRIARKHADLADKIAVIHSWANPSWIVPLSKEENWFAQEHQLDQTFTVMYSGNMGRCHDIDTILATMQLLDDDPSIRFVFIGGGAKRKLLVEQIEDLGLQNCLFLPYQNKTTLPYSLTACDLSLVSIGAGMEGLIAPSKVYGSLAAARPIAVICESHSYLREVIAAAGCGATFNIGDSQGLATFIQSLAAHRDLVTEMGLSGRRYMEQHFTPEIIGRQYVRVVKDTLQVPSSAVDSNLASPFELSLARKFPLARRLLNRHRNKFIP